MKRKTSQTNKTTPIPVRFEADERKQLEDLSEDTKLPVSTLIRMAVSYAVPKLASGEIDLSNFKRAAKAA